jgi:hypothetical protein
VVEHDAEHDEDGEEQPLVVLEGEELVLLRAREHARHEVADHGPQRSVAVGRAEVTRRAVEIAGSRHGLGIEAPGAVGLERDDDPSLGIGPVDVGLAVQQCARVDPVLGERTVLDRGAIGHVVDAFGLDAFEDLEELDGTGGGGFVGESLRVEALHGPLEISAGGAGAHCPTEGPHGGLGALETAIGDRRGGLVAGG